MKDAYGREITYLRISITDRCNLRCRYCMPNGIETIPMKELLTYEEIIKVVQAAADCGITKIKITGGEPLVRKGCTDLIRMIKNVPGIEQVTLTTNGILLAGQMRALLDAGLDAVNISLDTLHEEEYRNITGGGELSRVLAGVEAACAAGIPTKINVVLQKGRNADEWAELIELARSHPLDVRFIEQMPIGFGKASDGVSNEELLAWIRDKYTDLKEDQAIHGNGPAVYYQIPGFMGSIGFISAMHGKFCADCNRVRLTAQGKLKPCLCYGETVDLRSALRDETTPPTEDRLKKAFLEGISQKPEAHCFEEEAKITEFNRMSSIGG